MTRLVLLLFVLAAFGMQSFAQPSAQDSAVLYAPVTLCEISFHYQKANPKYVSLDGEFVNAAPHGAILLDHHCPGKGLQIDFPKTGLDSGAATLKDHCWEISRAKGTFRGMLDRDHRTGRLYLRVQSVLNFRPDFFYPDQKREPLRLPEPDMPTWPPSL